ncbi:topoisomerase DNA-binding C4 zinc finger domain-containing protein [Christiangramia sp. SM2212]|uniref:Topoisomerase DNA-binding C4 zinc finger domain-containing protein n=1 Tax=Christiangramia sediminicola TaxID=3073267 RepID=A0ABU1ERX5_9FLAO|nr:topoisomerase DNA-binding C4 zinc finger domain-containing protein [Christiangramia sp. SM2212]MDR5591126.1 topoisomerase DNA-binding C4 zinc finger domain-containing protein [Christiangramia sp. SM2212]
MKIQCKSCSGHYTLRTGKYGEFGGCSNYPNCTATIKLHDLVFQFFIEEGIQVFKWQKVCYGCKKKTDVYSYFLFYQLEKLDESYSAAYGLGVGDVPWIDSYLKNNISTVKDCYSKIINSTYTANTCQHCGRLQGKNYVVDDPHEIFTELFHEKSMNKFFHSRITVKETDIELRNEFHTIFSQI